EEVHQGGFARTGGAHHGQGAAGGHLQVHLVQDEALVPAGVAVGTYREVLGPQGHALALLQVSVAVEEVAAGVDDARDPVVPHHRPGQVAQDEPDGTHRYRHDGQQVGDGDHVTGGDHAVGHAEGAHC